MPSSLSARQGRETMSKVKDKPIHADHRARMQARVRRDGLDSLAEHEALEYLLFFAIPRKNTNPIAHALIQRFGNFCRVLEASEEELEQVEGIGPASARLIHSILEFSRYYGLRRRRTRVSLRETEKAIEYVRPLFFGLQQEALYLIAMDEHFTPLRDIRIAEGLPNKLTFDLSKLARAAVATGCTCAILAHNHPSGLAIASEADFATTVQVVKSLGLLGIDVLDHLIIAADDASSMRQSGRMPHYDSLNRQVYY